MEYILGKGQYAIKNLLGIGNFGNTYRAYDRNLDRSVVIKEYFPAEFSQREKDGLSSFSYTELKVISLNGV